MNKFHAIKTTLNGIKFDSRAEAERYIYLLSEQQSGNISGLNVHPVFELQPGFTYDGKRERAIKYISDFEYFRDGRRIIEDVKGGKATRTSEFEIKRKLFLFKYGNLIKFEIYEA